MINFHLRINQDQRILTPKAFQEKCKQNSNIINNKNEQKT